MGDIADISEKQEHIVAELICIRCCKRWASVRPATLLLAKMECPHCKAYGSVIMTGQELDVMEGGNKHDG